jgi:hypothetical protein
VRALRWLGFALVVLAALGVATYVAGEQTEVAVLRTVDDAGVASETKLWVVDLDGSPWVRVARPERSWFARLRNRPEVELVRHGVALPYRAIEIEDPAMRTRVDAAFRDKYGLVDWWYGLLLRRDPRPIRLDPANAGPREAMGP